MATKAVIKYQKNGNKELNGTLEVMFNPETYSVSRSVQYGHQSEDNGKNEKNSQNENKVLKDHEDMPYSGGSKDSLNFEIIINTYEFEHVSKQRAIVPSELDIVPKVKELKNLTLIDSTLHRPPLCQFEWSSFNFMGYVTSMNVNYTMFLDDGTPVRAKINITMQGAEFGTKDTIPFESPDRTKNRMLHENQQLWEIAQEEYDDASKWREIAKANNIKNPLYIKSGTRLIVPAITK